MAGCAVKRNILLLIMVTWWLSAQANSAMMIRFQKIICEKR